MPSFAPGAAYFTTNFGMTIIREDLLSHDETRQLSAMSRVIAYMATGKDMLGLFNEVAELVTASNVHIKRLVYLYLIQNSRNHPEKAVLQSGAFVKDTLHNSTLTRGAALRTMTSLQIHILSDFLTVPLLRSLEDSDAYVRRSAVWGVLKQYYIAPEQTIDSGLVDKLLGRLRDVNVTVVAAAVCAALELRMLRCPMHMTRALGEAQDYLREMLRTSSGRTVEWALCGLLNGVTVGMKLIGKRRKKNSVHHGIHSNDGQTTPGQGSMDAGSRHSLPASSTPTHPTTHRDSSMRDMVTSRGESVTSTTGAAAYLATAHDVTSCVQPYTMSDSCAVAVAAVRVLLVIQRAVQQIQQYMSTNANSAGNTCNNDSSRGRSSPLHTHAYDTAVYAEMDRLHTGSSNDCQRMNGDVDRCTELRSTGRTGAYRDDCALLVRRCVELAGSTMMGMAINAPRYEMRYAALRLLRRLLHTLPVLLLPRLRPHASFFFLDADDPVYVKKEKLSLLVTLATEETAPGILDELRRQYDCTYDPSSDHKSIDGDDNHARSANDVYTDQADSNSKSISCLKHSPMRNMTIPTLCSAAAAASASAAHSVESSSDKADSVDASEDDMSILSRRGVWCTGALAGSTPALARDCVHALHTLIQRRLHTGAAHLGSLAEYALYILQRVARHFPCRFDHRVAPLCVAVPALRATRTAVAVIWFLGDYGSRTPVVSSSSTSSSSRRGCEVRDGTGYVQRNNKPTQPQQMQPLLGRDSSSSYEGDLVNQTHPAIDTQTVLRRLGQWVERFAEEPAPVQLGLLTALMKLVLRQTGGPDQSGWGTSSSAVKLNTYLSSSLPASLSLDSTGVQHLRNSSSPEPSAANMLRTVLTLCTRPFTTDSSTDTHTAARQRNSHSSSCRVADTIRLDVRDRGLLYQRLLQQDRVLAYQVVCGGGDESNDANDEAARASVEYGRSMGHGMRSGEDTSTANGDVVRTASSRCAVAGAAASNAPSLASCLSQFGSLLSVAPPPHRVSFSSDVVDLTSAEVLPSDDLVVVSTGRWAAEDEEEEGNDFIGHPGNCCDISCCFAVDDDGDDGSSSSGSSSDESDSAMSEEEDEAQEGASAQCGEHRRSDQRNEHEAWQRGVTQGIVHSNNKAAHVTDVTINGLTTNFASTTPVERTMAHMQCNYTNNRHYLTAAAKDARDEDGYLTVLPACMASGVTARMKWSQIGTTLVLLCRFQLLPVHSSSLTPLPAAPITPPPTRACVQSSQCNTESENKISNDGNNNSIHLAKSSSSTVGVYSSDDCVHHARVTTLQINRNAFGLGVMQVFPAQVLDWGDRAVDVAVAVRCNNKRRATDTLELAMSIEPIGVRFARAPTIPPVLLLLPATGCDVSTFLRRHNSFGPPAWTMLPISSPFAALDEMAIAETDGAAAAARRALWGTHPPPQEQQPPHTAYQRRCVTSQLTSHTLRVHGLNLVRRRELPPRANTTAISGGGESGLPAKTAAASVVDNADSGLADSGMVQFFLYAETISHEALVIEAAVDAGVIILMTVRCAYAPLARTFGEYTLNIFTSTARVPNTLLDR